MYNLRGRQVPITYVVKKDEEPLKVEVAEDDTEVKPDELNVKCEENSVSASTHDSPSLVIGIQSPNPSASDSLWDDMKEDILGGIAALKDMHAQEVSAAKRKQWCLNCEREATANLHCCWNTSYCSTECQEEHWAKEHKCVCRRLKLMKK